MERTLIAGARESQSHPVHSADLAQEERWRTRSTSRSSPRTATSLGTAPRSRVHAEGLWHKSAQVFLFDGSGPRLYLQRRVDDKDVCPGLWDQSAAEHLKPGEILGGSMVRCAVWREELGVIGRIDPRGHSVNPFAGRLDQNGAGRARLTSCSRHSPAPGTVRSGNRPGRGRRGATGAPQSSSPTGCGRRPEDFTPWFLRDAVRLRRAPGRYDQRLATDPSTALFTAGFRQPRPASALPAAGTECSDHPAPSASEYRQIGRMLHFEVPVGRHPEPVIDVRPMSRRSSAMPYLRLPAPRSRHQYSASASRITRDRPFRIIRIGHTHLGLPPPGTRRNWCGSRRQSACSE